MASSNRSGSRPSDAVGRLLDGAVFSTLRRRGLEAVRLLAEAYRYSSDLQRSVWDFAVEADTLRAVGATPSELRWLVCKGYVAHASEITMPGEKSRNFRRPNPTGLTFSRKTCFALTEAGIAFAATLVDGPVLQPKPNGAPHGNGSKPASAAAHSKPTWDRDRQELRLGQIVIKQFKVPAPNQERVLAAFDEEGWPVHIDDPLPPAAEQDSKRRLHDTINSLNRNQKRRLLRFVGDGSGQGIRWELAADDSNGRAGCLTKPR